MDMKDKFPPAKDLSDKTFLAGKRQVHFVDILNDLSWQETVDVQ
jgi:hypothetical protein